MKRFGRGREERERTGGRENYSLLPLDPTLPLYTKTYDLDKARALQ